VEAAAAEEEEHDDRPLLTQGASRQSACSRWLICYAEVDKGTTKSFARGSRQQTCCDEGWAQRRPAGGLDMKVRSRDTVVVNLFGRRRPSVVAIFLVFGIGGRQWC
jgi:hypothetical protein